MARIYNSELSKELVEGARIQQGHDKIPQDLAEKVVPTMETNPKLMREITFIESYTRTTTAVAIQAMFTTHPDKDTYITQLFISNESDAACDNTGISVRIVKDSQPIILALIPKITATAISKTVSITYPQPIKVDRDSIVGFVNAFTAGVSTTHVVVCGFTVDNPKA